MTPKKFGDGRGFFSETYSARRFEQAGITDLFVQDNHSLSAQVGTVRGLHFQIAPHAQSKLVRVVRGAILDVALDIRRGSPTFGQHIAVELSAEAWNQLFVPIGFAHGFCTLQPDTEVLYKVNAYYAPEAEFGVLWCDEELGIDWPIGAGNPVLSEKDRRHPRLCDLPTYFTYESR